MCTSDAQRSWAQILNNKHHFKTLHAKLGFATSVLVFAVAAGGLVSFRKLGMLHHFPDRWQAVIKTSHRYVRPCFLQYTS